MSFTAYYWQYDPPALFVGWHRLDRTSAEAYGMKSRDEHYPNCRKIENTRPAPRGHSMPSHDDFCEVFMRQVIPWASYCIPKGTHTIFYTSKVLNRPPRENTHEAK